MPVCVGCQKLQRQVGKMWTKMSCLESDVQWHAKKVAEIQAEAKALEAALCKQKNEASVTEESESDSSSEGDAGCVGCHKLQKQISKMRTKMSCLESDVQWHAAFKILRGSAGREPFRSLGMCSREQSRSRSRSRAKRLADRDEEPEMA